MPESFATRNHPTGTDYAHEQINSGMFHSAGTDLSCPALSATSAGTDLSCPALACGQCNGHNKSVPAGINRHVVVLGLGNLLRRDEGLGIRALERLQERYRLPPEVQVIDGGTLGLELLSYIEGASHVLVLDAALTDSPAGTFIRLADSEMPAFFGIRTSPHEFALADLLAVMKLRGTEPGSLVVLGMQPETIELGWDLSQAVTDKLDAFVDMAVVELQQWQFAVTRREITKGTES
jgi:hydrogenase maturation protease